MQKLVEKIFLYTFMCQKMVVSSTGLIIVGHTLNFHKSYKTGFFKSTFKVYVIFLSALGFLLTICFSSCSL